MVVWGSKEEHAPKNTNTKNNPMDGDMPNPGHGGAKSRTATSTDSKEEKVVVKEKRGNASTVESTVTYHEIVLNHAVKKEILRAKGITAKAKVTVVVKDTRAMGKAIIPQPMDPTKERDRKVQAKEVPGMDAGYAEAIITKKIVRETKGKGGSGRWMDGNKKDKQLSQQPSPWHA